MAVEEPPQSADRNQNLALGKLRLQLGECDVGFDFDFGDDEAGMSIDPCRPSIATLDLRDQVAGLPP